MWDILCMINAVSAISPFHSLSIARANVDINDSVSLYQYSFRSS
jgi:hypothetical protein